MELRLKESNSEKQQKVASLVLSDEEWTRVRLFCNILQARTITTYLKLELLMYDFIQHANDAQQAFSLSSAPTLQNALPALERMYAAWEKSSSKPRYACFVTALDAGMAKLDDYYQRSTASDAHIMAMGNSFLFPVIVYTVLIGVPRLSPQPKEEDGTFYKTLASRQS